MELAGIAKNIRIVVRNTGFTNRFYFVMLGIAILFVLGFIVHSWFMVARIIFVLFLSAILVDYLLLIKQNLKVFAKRIVPPRLSNGDINQIKIELSNHALLTNKYSIIDEIPIQFQVRDFLKVLRLIPGQCDEISYTLKPLKRGEYKFGRLLVYVSTPLELIVKRFVFDQQATVPVYPSYMQMHKYQLMAISNRLVDAGIKPIRKVGHHSEFDQIRNYITGDDYRTINWKATARKADLMVNQFMEEKSQPVISIIDMGRNMQSPFEGMTLLDYSINASLVFSNIALLKSDKAGLITFSKEIDSFLHASNRPVQMQYIMELLYSQRTNFDEPNFELLYASVKRNITQRSLLLIYTNFESVVSLKKQLGFLTGLAKNHVVLVIFFKNTEMYKLTESKPETTEDIYIQTIAEKMIYDKSLIERELQMRGILTLLTTPEQLTPNVVNEYLKIKARGIL